MKKVVAVFASPNKRGNSFKLLQKIEDELTVKNDVEVEKIFLADYDLGRCVGCHQCILKGEEKCPYGDSRDVILNKMMCADGIIFISPIYCMQISYLLKELFDRLAFMWHRPRMFGIKVMAAVVGAGAGPVAKPALNYIRLNAERWGADYIGGISVVRFDAAFTKSAQRDQIKAIKSGGEKFYKALFGKKYLSPGLAKLFWFSTWKNSAILSGKDKLRDFSYWREKGWLKRGVNYYFKVGINPIALLLSKLINKIVVVFMRSRFTTFDDL